jgi:uncharacterized protein YcfL
MNSREAVKETLRLLFYWLEERGYEFTKEERANAIEIMHDDSTFFDELMDFFEGHINDFRENYELYLEE